MSQAENPERLTRKVTVDDVRQLMGASTPHFALQLRNRIARLIADLPKDDPARVIGEQEIWRLTALGTTGEVRGHHAEQGMVPLRSVTAPGADLGGPGSEEPAPSTTVH
ncbi:MAG TPA: hypothetical protein VGM33_02725 [Baekduia sp.]|jgi:hypothetical protein